MKNFLFKNVQLFYLSLLGLEFGRGKTTYEIDWIFLEELIC
jgi:hypothetical protein